MISDRRRPVLVLCASLPSSGSTWLFNAVAELLRHTAAAAQPNQVFQFYADRMADFPELVEMPDYLVVKTHTADAPMRLLLRIAGGPLLITVREPRDAVASLMSRFGFPFDVALKNVEAAAACMVDLAALGASLVLRYEDRFFDREKTMVSLARCLGVKVPISDAKRIFGSLTRAAVAEKIDELTRQGVFGPDATFERFDPKTHWHPGHLGSGETGRYLQVLSSGQQARVMLATQEFCQAFGYSTELPEGVSRTCPIGRPILFGKVHDSAQFLTEGWGLPGGPFVWAIGERSQITLDIGDLPAYPDVYRLRLAVQPFTASGVPFQRVSIFLNDVQLSEDRLVEPTTLEVTMPRALLAARQPAFITLVHQDAARPCDFDPGNADERMISIGLHSLEILAGGVDE